MNRKTLILLIVLAAAAAFTSGAVATYFAAKPPAKPPQAICTLEAKLCPDGSYVSRTGPDCAFAPCPGTGTVSGCKSDADCPPTSTCEAIMGEGTVSPDGGPSTFRITQGVCKSKESAVCRADQDCAGGFVCHQGVCTSPQGSVCAGAGAACPKGYQCVQDCGPPVVRQDEPPPGWHCLIDEVAARPRMCPICLAEDTRIAAPGGDVRVQDVRVGMLVWTAAADGNRIVVPVVAVGSTTVTATHRVVHLMLDDGREVWVSPDHPTADGRRAGDLRADETYDGSKVKAADLTAYEGRRTYDLLPDGPTGSYWANGILLGSTLAPAN